MSFFVLSEQGLILNRHAALDAGRVAIAAWDLGSNDTSSFLSAKPDLSLGLPPGRLLEENFYGCWSLAKGTHAGQVLVTTAGKAIGQVNRRAAAILAPLLEGGLVGVEVRQNQEAGGRRNQVLYIYALLGVDGNEQVVREPESVEEMRAYIALLACTMKVLKSADLNLDRDWDLPVSDSSGEDRSEEGREEENTAPWSLLPGAVSWDYATGGEGNTINRDLINQLGARTLLKLKQLGASINRS